MQDHLYKKTTSIIKNVNNANYHLRHYIQSLECDPSHNGTFELCLQPQK